MESSLHYKKKKKKQKQKNKNKKTKTKHGLGTFLMRYFKVEIRDTQLTGTLLQ
jgi:hypothetical protein